MLHLGHHSESLEMEVTLSILTKLPNDIYAQLVLRNPLIVLEIYT